MVVAQKEPCCMQRQQMATAISHFREKPALQKYSSAIKMLIFHEPQVCPSFSSLQRIMKLEANTRIEIVSQESGRMRRGIYRIHLDQKRTSLAGSPYGQSFGISLVLLHSTTETSARLKTVTCHKDPNRTISPCYHD